MSNLRCIQCCSSTSTSPCEHCGSEFVEDPSKPHRAHWSRATMEEVECKICLRRGPYSIMFDSNADECKGVDYGKVNES